jgi:RHS repeat-associated protein
MIGGEEAAPIGKVHYAIRSQTGSSSNYWLFTGEQRDSESSFYLLRARYFDSSTDWFLSQDAVPGFMGRPQSQNPTSTWKAHPPASSIHRGCLLTLQR